MLLQRFRSHLHSLRLPPGPALVAVSGGPDSTALLDLLVRSDAEAMWPLTVVHVDHGIDPASADAEELVRRLAEAYGLPLDSAHLGLGAGTSETVARAARYEAIEAIRQARGAATVFLGHHADDQAETILMRALAGSGPGGLGGMRSHSGPYARPLLPFPSRELREYLAERDIATWDDPANRDPRHLRSWLRQELLPRVEARVPDVRDRLLRTGELASRNRDAWDTVLPLLPGLDPVREGDAVSVAAPVLGGYDSALGAAVLIALGRRAGCTIGAARAARVLRLVRSGTSGQWVPLGSGRRAALAFGRLRIEAPADVAEAPLELDAPGVFKWGRWTVTIRPEAAPAQHQRGGSTAWFANVPLSVRRLRAGDRIAPLGGTGHRLVVRCFQDARVPRSRRADWPVLESNGVVVWVPGVSRSGALIPPAGSEALRVDVTHD